MKYFNLTIKSFLLIIILALSFTSFSQTFTQQPDLPSTYSINLETIDLGDYDNDGFLDILATYIYNGGSMPDRGITKVYRNNGDNTFTEQKQILLKGVFSGSAKWGDYNNDGYLDIIVSGLVQGPKSWTSASARTSIYKNNANGTFTIQKDILLPDLSGSFVSWGDYDNDGYLDILLTGSGVSKIFRNNGNSTFTEQTEIHLAGITSGAVAWGDYNNDGYLDIVLTGSGISKIYRNNADNSFTEQTGISLAGVSHSSVAWGDYDNDGYSDLLLAGRDVDNLNISKLYRNNGDNTFTEQDGISLAGISFGSAIWGDYNNDGYLDILLSGDNRTAKIYRNNGNNTFSEQTSISLPGVLNKCIGWGDLNNDKSLDIIVGSSIYTNNIKVANINTNNSPAELKHIVTSNNVKLMWQQSTQTLPGKGGSYNLNVYNKTKSINALPSNSANNGFRKVVSIGNAQLNTTYILKDLKIGTYYWQVQSVENNYQGGAFSVIDTFVVNTHVQSSALIISNIDGANALLEWKRGNLENCAVFIKEGSGNLNLSNNTTYSASNIFKKGSEVGEGWFCIYSGTGESVQVSGLNGLTNYTAVVIEFDGSKGNEQYLSTFSTDNSVAFKTNNFTVQSNISLTSVTFACSAWGDYNNDGYLDILLAGNSINGPVSKIYRNNGDNTLTEQTGVSLTGVEGGSVAWGDYNNDGYLDILLAGYSINGSVSKIYRNNGGNTFTEQTSISLAGINDGSAVWGDYDNDGYLDILLVGNRISKIYHNNGDGSFSESDISLAGVENGSAAWGDYNNDGFLDVLITGNTMSSLIAKIYRNNGGKTFSEQSGIKLTGVYYSAVAWGDYNNDGYLDILISGNPNYGVHTTKIYKNNGDNTFTEQTGIDLTGVEMGALAWGDYDNDGKMDILLTGYTNNGAVSEVYRNNGDNSFTNQTDVILQGISSKTVVWGDYDNDGDMDILLGNKLYKNYVTSKPQLNPNKKPLAPKGLTSAKVGNEFLLSWTGDSTDETPENTMSYNVAIAKNKSLLSLGRPQNDETIHKVSGLGNSNINNFYKVKLEAGRYYWQVQAIDGGYNGGEFSNIDSIEINPPVQAHLHSITEISNSSALVKWMRGNLENCIIFIKEGSGSFIPTNNTTYSAAAVYMEGLKISNGWYCLYKGTDDSLEISGLNSNTDYTIEIFEYSGISGSEQYLSTISSKNKSNFTTGYVGIQSGIYPNPVQTKLTIVKKDKTEISHLNIYSIDGSILFNTILKDEVTVIDMSTYIKGIYILKISSSEKVTKMKLIKI